MKSQPRVLNVIVLVVGIASTLAADEKRVRPLGENVLEYRNVRYLADSRYPQEGERERTYQMTMDIAVPDDGKEQHPVLFVVHGGGWSAGSKDDSSCRKIMSYFVKRGYVCIGFNYMLRPRGVFPQIFWDYETAARYLRTNAAKYQVDPTRFGAIGLSAGGWLISSAGHATGDLYLRNHQASWHIGELWERDWQRPDDDWNESFLRPMSNPQPDYPDEYGRFQAISMDFQFRIQYGSGNSPSMNNWIGQGGKMRDYQEEAAHTGEFDYTETLWIHPKYQGKSVHVPPLFKSIRKDGNEAAAIGFDGEKSDDAIQQIDRFFQHHLVEDPRTPMPAFHPTSRFFQDELAVSFVMPKMDYEIRYQVLPLEWAKGKRWDEGYPSVQGDEWKSWRKYEGPFKIDQHALVRAVAISEGRRPSTIAEGHFFKDVVDLPKVTSPAGDALPPGQTGKPYSVTFAADVDSPRWYLSGDLVPWERKGQVHYPNNMLLDRKSGTWSGTPTKPGKYWVQIWVNDGDGRIADYRDYTWIVEGEDLSPDDDLFQTPPVDPYIELVYLSNGKVRASRLSHPLRQAGVRYTFQDDKQRWMMLVQRDDAAEARRTIETKLKEWNHDGSLEWRD